MTGEWLPVKWVVLSMVACYLILLCVAAAYLRRDLPARRRLGSIGIAMLLATLLPHTVADVFENAVATRLAYVLTGAVSVGAIAILVRLLAGRRNEVSLTADD